MAEAHATVTAKRERLEPGLSTATGTNVEYRLGKLQARGLLKGLWLDCGCADGGYSVALRERGADRVVGFDIEQDRVAQATKLRSDTEDLSFCCGFSEALPFRDDSFDGVFLNEVLEHVVDEGATLAEIRRVLRPGGRLVLMSPNRWFPFEGHGATIGRWSTGAPVPLLPWLPTGLSKRWVKARNYWPYEMRNLVRKAGFHIVSSESIFPVLEVYPWLPQGLIRVYRRIVPTLEKLPFIRRFGVSTFVLAEK